MLRTTLCSSLLVLSWLGSLRAQPSEANFRTNTAMVLVPVTVTDHFGKTLEGLRASDFTVLDDQGLRQIVSFTNDDAPSSVGLVLDISGSMKYSLGSAKEVARAFFETANPSDEFQLLTVSTTPAAESGFTTDAVALEQTISYAKADGMTALIDTVYMGLNRMRKARHSRRALLILSDGMDNNSRYSQSELLRVALEADVQVYAVIMDGISGGGPGGGAPYRPTMALKPIDQARLSQPSNLLEELANKTGGLSFHAHDEAQAKEAMVKAGRALRSEYLIGYQAPEGGAPEKWHRVRVKTSVPKVVLHARSGYYAP